MKNKDFFPSLVDKKTYILVQDAANRQKLAPTSETISLYDDGLAEHGDHTAGDGLYSYLRNQSYDINKAVDLGLLIKNRENNRLYDRFRGRIIFPIFAESNNLVAFGGRTVYNDPNKYLNSPDTPLYKKNKTHTKFTSKKIMNGFI